MRDNGQERCKTEGMQDRRDAGLEGCRTEGMQDGSDAWLIYSFYTPYSKNIYELSILNVFSDEVRHPIV